MRSDSRPVPPISEAVVAEFWRRVRKTDTCWFWIGGKRSADGYGVFRVPIDTPYGRAQLGVAAHKIAYVLARGEIPRGLILRHSCDTPPCVRPEHLTPGTHKENSADAWGGRRRGHWSKLTDETVGEMRTLYFNAHMTVGALARRYGMSKPGVIAVLIGESHKMAPGPMGPIRKVMGPAVFGAKLNERSVAEIRGRFAKGETIYDLAAAFRVAFQTISKIIRNVNWKHVAPMPSRYIRRGHNKLTRGQVTKIRQRHARGVSQARLSADYHVSRATISMIVNRKVHERDP